MRTCLAFWPALALLGGPVWAADSASALTLEQLDQRIRALETEAQRLREQAASALQEAQAARAELQRIQTAQAETAAVAQAVPVESAASSSSQSGNAFNPAIGVVLNGVYAHHSLAPDDYSPSGFPLVGEGGPGSPGLALGESEMAFSANIDDKFYGQITLAIESDDGETEVGIEEAYIDTLALPEGFALRAGRFFSNIGYLNSRHAHTDSFSDRPLAYQALLGNQYGDDGVQLRWVAPTDIYIEFGGEVLRGAQADGLGAHTFFVHAGGDVGTEHAWLAGVSLLESDIDLAEDGFSGEQSLYLADLTWKWAPRGNFNDGGIALRSEFILDDRVGTFVDLADPSEVRTWDGQRRGAYLEGAYRINRTWETGYRYDRLWADDAGPYASDYDPVRNSVMLTWRNSEFSLLRLQYSYDEPNAEDSDRAISLQYQVNLGAHGAHKF